MIVAVTGTRHGATREQLRQLARLLLPASELHHGDCVGVDQQAHEIAFGWFMWTVVHPPSKRKFRAFCEGDRVLEPRPYIARNRDLVLASNLVLAVPGDGAKTGGTWSTIRFARTIEAPLAIIWPGGTVTRENGA